MWGLASPPHPSGRTESCTPRILRMLFWCSRERMVKKMQGDSAPCGTTDRNAAAPLLLTHAGSAARSAFLVYFVVSHPHMQCFFAWSVGNDGARGLAVML